MLITSPSPSRFASWKHALLLGAMQRGEAIILIGFMGSGKSSVGRSLAQKTKWPRYDTDEMIEAAAGLSIAEIFSERGEEYFRGMETDVLKRLATQSAIVVTGGGVVLRNENLLMLRRLGTIVYLKSDEEIMFERVSQSENRPLLRTENPRASFHELLRIRTPIYDSVADIVVDTSALSPTEIADQILMKIDERIEV